MKERVRVQVEYVGFFLYTFTRKGINPPTDYLKIQKTVSTHQCSSKSNMTEMQLRQYHAGV